MMHGPTNIIVTSYLEKLPPRLWSGKFAPYVEFDGSLPCSQKQVTGPYTEKLKYILIFSIPKC